MPKLIIVIGLTGSGKTTYLESLKERREVEYIYSDYHARAFNDSHDIKASRYYNDLIDNLKNGKDCAIDDIEFCKTQHLDYVVNEIVKLFPSITIVYRYFENNPDACLRNILFRNRGDVKNQIDHVNRYTKFYKIPENIIPMPIPDASS